MHVLHSHWWLVHCLEVSATRGDEVLLLLSILAPGALGLDARLDARCLGDGRLSPGQQLLARSNVVALSIYDPPRDPAKRSLNCLASVPHLCALYFENMNFAQTLASTLMTTFRDQPLFELPLLRPLRLYVCTIDTWAAGILEQIAGRTQLHTLALMDCEFPPSFTQPMNQRFPTNEDYKKYQAEMPQGMRDWFLERVRGVVVDKRPDEYDDRLYPGVDPFMQKLI